MSRNLSIILYLTHFNVFSFTESSILSIKYVFSFFLVFKFYNSGLQIIHLDLNHLRFLGGVDIGG